MSESDAQRRERMAPFGSLLDGLRRMTDSSLATSAAQRRLTQHLAHRDIHDLFWFVYLNPEAAVPLQ